MGIITFYQDRAKIGSHFIETKVNYMINDQGTKIILQNQTEIDTTDFIFNLKNLSKKDIIKLVVKDQIKKLTSEEYYTKEVSDFIANELNEMSQLALISNALTDKVNLESFISYNDPFFTTNLFKFDTRKRLIALNKSTEESIIIYNDTLNCIHKTISNIKALFKQQDLELNEQQSE